MPDNFRRQRANLRTWSQCIIGSLARTYHTERAAFSKDSSTELDTPWGCDLTKRVTSLKGPILETDYWERQLDNLQLMTALPCCRSDLGCSLSYLDMTKHWRGVEGPVRRLLPVIEWDADCFGISLPIVILELPNRVAIFNAWPDNRLKSAMLLKGRVDGILQWQFCVGRD